MTPPSPLAAARPVTGDTQAGHTPPTVTAGQFRRGVFSVGGGSLFSVAALFVEAIIVARALPFEDMGVYVFFQASLALLIIAVDLGFRTTAAQFLAAETSREGKAELADSLLLVRLLVLGVLAAPLLLAAVVLPGWLNMPGLRTLLAFMPVVLALASLDELFTGYLQGLQCYRAIAVAQVTRGALRLALSAGVLLVLGLGLNALLLSWIVSYGVSAALQYMALGLPRNLRFSGARVREALRFGMPLQATRYLWFGMQRVDTFVLTAFTGPVGVAFYDVAGRVPQGLQRLAEAYYAVFHPSLAARFARRDAAGARRLMAQSLRLFGTGTLLAAWFAVLFGRDVIVLLFEERYAAAAPAFAIILLAFSLTSSLNLMGYTLTASGRPGQSFAMNLLRSSVSLGSDLVLIPLMGFIGAAYATLAAQLAAAPLAWWYLRRARLPAYGRIHVRHYALAAAVFAALLWLPPLSLGARLALLALFPVVALAVGLLAPADLMAAVPARVWRRAPLAPEMAPHRGGSEQ